MKCRNNTGCQQACSARTTYIFSTIPGKVILPLIYIPKLGQDAYDVHVIEMLKLNQPAVAAAQKLQTFNIVKIISPVGRV